jgi:N-acetylneuraminate synthase
MISRKEVKVGSFLMSESDPAFIVAELGINHNGEMSIARDLISAAASAGANAVKFQKRTPELCVPVDQRLKERETPWGLMTYMDYRYRMEFDRNQYIELMSFAHEFNLEFFATPWDEESLKFLIDIGVPCIKIASASLTDLNLISESAASGLPVIISTGMSTMENIVAAAKILEGHQHIIAHSTSTYPCPVEELNLSMIDVLKKQFNCIVGYSGHESGVSTTVAAVVLGAKYIERHLTLDRAMWGSDHAASLEPQGFTRLVRDIRIFEHAIGDGVKKLYPSEIPYLEKLRRIK